MNLFSTKNEKVYGRHRAKIEEVIDSANGIYRVRVYPFHKDIEVTNLPKAPSNLTNRVQHINLLVGDMVWCFFENGDKEYPIIDNLCNFKDSYPSPSYVPSDNYSAFQLGNVNVEVDETTECNILINDGELIFDTGNKDIVLSANKIFINGNQINLGDSLGYVVTCSTPNTTIVTQSGVTLKSSGKIKG